MQHLIDSIDKTEDQGKQLLRKFGLAEDMTMEELFSTLRTKFEADSGLGTVVDRVELMFARYAPDMVYVYQLLDHLLAKMTQEDFVFS